MGSTTLPRCPAADFWVVLWLGVFARGMFLVAARMTDPKEYQALLAMKATFDDPNGNLNSWVENTDPCDQWNWVVCDEGGEPSYLDASFSHVTSLRLLNLSLGGQLDDNVTNLLGLMFLDVMWNSLNGSIPTSIGRLQGLEHLLLSGNEFSGVLPLELGSLSNLVRLQVDENKFSGEIPLTFLNLTGIWHIHMNNNSLSGSLPSGLGRLQYLMHVLVDNNQLTGTLPDDLATAPNLRVIQMDNNRFDGIPAVYTRIPTLQKFSMRNCSLKGLLPNFNESTSLAVLDLSYNSFTGSLPTFALPVNITSVDLSYNNLHGAVPQSFGNLQDLTYLELRNNNLSGDIAANLGLGPSFNASGFQRRLILDFQNNSLKLASGSVLPVIYADPMRQLLLQVWLSGNPIACPPNIPINNPFCVPNSVESYLAPQFWSDTWCSPCSSLEQLRPPPVRGPPSCSCAIPIIISYRLKSPPFVIFDSYETQFCETIASELDLAPDQVGIGSTEYVVGPRINLTIFIFPPDSENSFNDSEARRITGKFYNWQLPENIEFGPYEILGISCYGDLCSAATNPSALSSHRSHGMNTGLIVGIICGAIVVSAIVTALLMHYSSRRRRFWRVLSKGNYQTPINIPGVRCFTFTEMVKATGNFREENLIGQGGYGKVYLGTLVDGQKVAVKRAEEGSFQGLGAFENEIHLLSRVHHRNLVILVGYCNDNGERINGEQMLVYEFVPNGNLREHLVPGCKAALDITSRLRIAIGSARGIQYLHTEADPPIFHRDIKADNILIDGKFNPKVSDFGLSKLAQADANIEGIHTGHITTVVKGTPGYLDPEYFLTRKLTDKSDVYSFGVVLLELISGKPPIVNGKNLIREVNAAYREGDVMSIVDERMGLYSMGTIEAFIKLGLCCVDIETENRPNMTDVVHELEEIWKEASWSGVISHGYMGDSSGELGSEKIGAQQKHRFQRLESSNASPRIRPFLSPSESLMIEVSVPVTPR